MSKNMGNGSGEDFAETLGPWAVARCQKQILHKVSSLSMQNVYASSCMHKIYATKGGKRSGVHAQQTGYRGS